MARTVRAIVYVVCAIVYIVCLSVFENAGTASCMHVQHLQRLV